MVTTPRRWEKFNPSPRGRQIENLEGNEGPLSPPVTLMPLPRFLKIIPPSHFLHTKPNLFYKNDSLKSTKIIKKINGNPKFVHFSMKNKGKVEVFLSPCWPNIVFNPHSFTLLKGLLLLVKGWASQAHNAETTWIEANFELPPFLSTFQVTQLWFSVSN